MHIYVPVNAPLKEEKKKKKKKEMNISEKYPQQNAKEKFRKQLFVSAFHDNNN